MNLNRTKPIRMLRAQLKAAPNQAKLLGGLAVVLVIAIVRMVSTLGPESSEAALVQVLAPADTLSTALPVHAASPPRSTVRPVLPDLTRSVSRDLFSAAWLDRSPQWDPMPVIEPVVESVIAPPTEDTDVTDLVLELTLTGATESGQHYAVISGQRLRIGESIRGYVVEAIAPGLVVLSDDQRSQIVIRMN